MSRWKPTSWYVRSATCNAMKLRISSRGFASMPPIPNAQCWLILRVLVRNLRCHSRPCGRDGLVARSPNDGGAMIALIATASASTVRPCGLPPCSSGGRLGQAVTQLTLVLHCKQHHFSLGMGVEHDVTSRHHLPQLGLAKCTGNLPCLLSLKLPPARPGIKKPMTGRLGTSGEFQAWLEQWSATSSKDFENDFGPQRTVANRSFRFASA